MDQHPSHREKILKKKLDILWRIWWNPRSSKTSKKNFNKQKLLMKTKSKKLSKNVILLTITALALSGLPGSRGDMPLCGEDSF